MPAKSVHPATGLQVQIDELDALLDRLLQLPLGPAPTLTHQTKAPVDSELSLESFSQDPILSFEFEATEEAEPPAAPRLAVVTGESSHEALPESGLAEEADQPTLPLRPASQEPTVPVLDPDKIPWIEDEPSLRVNATAKLEELDRTATEPPLLRSRGLEPAAEPGAGTGARVEIIIGPTRTILSNHSAALPLEIAGASDAGHSAVRRLFWWWTWLFDQSVGRLFPKLRRPGAKLFLGCVGLGLIIGSGYLLRQRWQWW